MQAQGWRVGGGEPSEDHTQSEQLLRCHRVYKPLVGRSERLRLRWRALLPLKVTCGGDKASVERHHQSVGEGDSERFKAEITLEILRQAPPFFYR